MMPNHSGNRPQRGNSPYSITRRTVPGGVTGRLAAELCLLLAEEAWVELQCKLGW